MVDESRLLLRWTALLPHGMTALVFLGQSFELLDLDVEDSAQGEEEAQQLQTHRETSAAAELRRAIARTASAASEVETIRARLQRLLGVWQRSRRGTALLQPSIAGGAARRPGPRLFADRVGSHVAEVSWEPLGGVDLEAAFYEVVLYRHRSAAIRASRDRRGDEDGLESLGSFNVPGGPAARNFSLRRLEPLRWYRARVRALGPRRSWVSDWSREVSFKTLSIQDTRAAGLHVTADNFLVKSERRIHSAIFGTQQEESEDAPGLLPTPTEVDRLRVEQVRELLGEPDDTHSYDAVKNLLDARYCKGGWQDFARLGLRFARPAAQQEQRLRRMKLAVAAKELYGTELPNENAWSMGPFYYEEFGLQNSEASARL